MPVDFVAIFAIAAVFGSGTLILRPLAKAMAGRIAGRTAAEHDAGRVHLLEQELQDAILRLSAAESELARTAEKVEFMEKLLAPPSAPAATPQRATATAGVGH